MAKRKSKPVLPPVTGPVDGQTLFKKVDDLSMNLNAIDDVSAVVGECLRGQDCELDNACANMLNTITSEIELARKTLSEIAAMTPRATAVQP